MHLGVHFPGVNNTTVWSDPMSGSQVEFASFAYLAQRAERAKLDFFFLAEGLRLREHRDQIFDLDVVGRPDSLTVLAALAAVTDRIGLAATLNTTFNEPYELARQFASLDHLSHGRAAWNAVTSPDAFTGENFRRGGFLDPAHRYDRAAELIDIVQQLWDSWSEPRQTPSRVAFLGKHFSVAGRFNVPRPPQGHPIQIQAGDSDGGRNLAARYADVIFSRHAEYADGRAFYEDVKGRLARYGREPDDLKILPASTVALGDSPAEADEFARHIRRQQISPQGAIAFLESLWGRDLSTYDPEGPLPDVEPDVEGMETISKGRIRQFGDPIATASKWRQLADAEKLSIRELVIRVSGRIGFVGTPSAVAERIHRSVQDNAADGYIFIPHLTPKGLDDFFDRVVPLLQDMGSFRADYSGSTLRDHLGLGPAQ